MRWILLMIMGALLVIATVCFALSGSLNEKAIIERIKPFGSVTVESNGQVKTETPTTTVADIGQNRYEQTCKMCHETGLADAPKLGDKAAWKPRIDQGMETLYKHAIQGLKAMPPKGGCMSCSDEEIHKAVDYMVSRSGVKSCNLTKLCQISRLDTRSLHFPKRQRFF
jgi:cytochrome c5